MPSSRRCAAFAAILRNAGVEPASTNIASTRIAAAVRSLCVRVHSSHLLRNLAYAGQWARDGSEDRRRFGREERPRGCATFAERSQVCVRENVETTVEAVIPVWFPSFGGGIPAGGAPSAQIVKTRRELRPSPAAPPPVPRRPPRTHEHGGGVARVVRRDDRSGLARCATPDRCRHALPPRSPVAFARGARGTGARLEDEVRRASAPLQEHGWRLRHSLSWQRRGDIDSVAIAPTGVGFAIETNTQNVRLAPARPGARAG